MAPMPVLVLFMAAILILTFRSVLIAGILGVIAMMAVGMAVLSTWLIDFPISFNTFMGTFGLIGVALDDSIVVMAAIRSNPKAAAGHDNGHGRPEIAPDDAISGKKPPIVVSVVIRSERRIRSAIGAK